MSFVTFMVFGRFIQSRNNETIMHLDGFLQLSQTMVDKKEYGTLPRV
jgi:hypothetical protein